MAERGAEDDRVLPLATQTAAAGGAAAMPVDVGCRLGFGVLEPAEQILGVLQAQADRLEPVTALVELQDHLIPDHGIIIADDAQLKLNAQG